MEPDPWDAVLIELGYLWCRPCEEWHRPPEHAIDSDGNLLEEPVYDE